MASPFHITLDPKQKTLALTAGGKGEIVFSHTNSASAAVRGSLRLSKVGDVAGKWVKLDGPAERDFQGTQRIAVKIDLPLNAAPGQYTFRLDSYSVENPDEEFTEGPTVGFEVKKPDGPPPKPVPWLWIAIAAAVLVVLIGGGIAFALTRGIAVPNVVNTPADQAVQRLKDANLDPATTQQSVPGLAADKNNTVLSTDPKAGTKVKKGAKVNVVVQTAAPLPLPPPGGRPPIFVPQGQVRDQIIRDHRRVVPQ